MTNAGPLSYFYRSSQDNQLSKLGTDQKDRGLGNEFNETREFQKNRKQTRKKSGDLHFIQFMTYKKTEDPSALRQRNLNTQLDFYG